MTENIADQPILGSTDPEVPSGDSTKDAAKKIFGKKKLKKDFPLEVSFYKGKSLEAVLAELKTTNELFTKSKAYAVFKKANTEVPAVGSDGEKKEDKGKSWADKAEEEPKTESPKGADSHPTNNGKSEAENLRSSNSSTNSNTSLDKKLEKVEEFEKSIPPSDIAQPISIEDTKRMSLKSKGRDAEHADMWTKIFAHVRGGGKIFVMCIRDVISQKFWDTHPKAAQSIIFRGNSAVDYGKMHENGVVHFGMIANPKEIERMKKDGWMFVAQSTNVKHIKSVIKSNTDKLNLALSDLAQIQRLYSQNELVSGFINMPCQALKKLLDSLPELKPRAMDVEKRKNKSNGEGSDVPEGVKV